MEYTTIMSECITFTQANIIYNSRILWRELTFWSRAFFDSIYNGIGSTQSAFTQLFNTPNEYAYSLRFIFSRSTVENYISYFNQYVINLRELISASEIGDLDAMNEKVANLYDIIERQAAFFAEIFPALEADVLKEMLTAFLTLQIEEINSYILEDYGSQLKIFDEILTLTDRIADYLSYGTINLITAAPKPESLIDNQESNICITFDEFNIIMNSALFWVNLILWFREYRISVMADLGNQEELYNRLIQTTVDYRNFLNGFFDEEALDYQIGLIQEYIRLMNELLNARLNGEIENMNRIYQLIMSNIEERGAISNANLPLPDGASWTDEFIKLNSNLINMSTQFLTGDYFGAIEIFNGLLNQAEDIGSMLTKSIAEQFIASPLA